MTMFEFMDKVLEAFPEATVEADNEGQLIVCTNLTYDENDNVFSMGD